MKFLPQSTLSVDGTLRVQSLTTRREGMRCGGARSGHIGGPRERVWWKTRRAAVNGSTSAGGKMAKEKALEVAWRSGHKKLGALCSFMSALDGTGQKILGEPRSLPESGLWDMTFANQEAVQTLVGSLRHALLPQTFSQGQQLLAVTLRGGQ